MNHLKHILFILFTSLAAQGAVPSNLFTPAEIKLHQQNINAFNATAQKCLTDTYNDHVRFFVQWQVSKYFGDANPNYQTKEGLIDALTKYHAPTNLIDQMKPMSCIGYAMICVKQGLESTNQDSVWQKMYKQLSYQGLFEGTDLQVMLQQLGWKIYYWNPDPSQNAAWDQEDQQLNPLQPGMDWMPVWGGHAFRYETVMQHNSYYGISVDNKTDLVNFKTTQPKVIKQAPFFVGTAHAGYHVFMGFMGYSWEGHSTREINTITNLETGIFNPLISGSSPVWTETEKYRSGLIAIPPEQIK